MAENGQAPRRGRGGETARHRTSSLAAQWRMASPRREGQAMERRSAAEVGGDGRGGRSDDGADFVRRAIQDLFR